MEHLDKRDITATIRQMKKAREEMKRAVSLEDAATKPRLTDLSLIKSIYGKFTDMVGKERISVSERKMFIFIIQYLYAPRNIFGARMPRMLRGELANVLGVNSVCVISQNGADTLHHYRVYTSFRQETNRILTSILTYLSGLGKI